IVATAALTASELVPHVDPTATRRPRVRPLDRRARIVGSQRLDRGGELARRAVGELDLEPQRPAALGEPEVLVARELGEPGGVGHVAAVDREHDVLLGEPELLERTAREADDHRAAL